MMDSEKTGTGANVTGGSKRTGSSEATEVSDGKRSVSDERRLKNALEDDEVKDALRALRGTKSTPRGTKRP